MAGEQPSRRKTTGKQPSRRISMTTVAGAKRRKRPGVVAAQGFSALVGLTIALLLLHRMRLEVLTTHSDSQCVSSIANSSDRTPTTPCAGHVGDPCAFSCEAGHEPVGENICGADGHFSGGRCQPCGRNHWSPAGGTQCLACAKCANCEVLIPCWAKGDAQVRLAALV